jgi:hypothetical protein
MSNCKSANKEETKNGVKDNEKDNGKSLKRNSNGFAEDETEAKLELKKIKTTLVNEGPYELIPGQVYDRIVDGRYEIVIPGFNQEELNKTLDTIIAKFFISPNQDEEEDR